MHIRSSQTAPWQPHGAGQRAGAGSGLPPRRSGRGQRAEGRSAGAAEAPRPAGNARPRRSKRPTTGRPTRSPWPSSNVGSWVQQLHLQGRLPLPQREHRPGVHCETAIATASARAPASWPRSTTRSRPKSGLSTSEGRAIRVRSNQTLTGEQHPQGRLHRSGLCRMAAAGRLEIHRRQDEVSVGAPWPERVLRRRHESRKVWPSISRTATSSPARSTTSSRSAALAGESTDGRRRRWAGEPTVRHRPADGGRELLRAQQRAGPQCRSYTAQAPTATPPRHVAASTA